MKNKIQKASRVLSILFLLAFIFFAIYSFIFFTNEDRKFLEDKSNNVESTFGYLIESQFSAVQDIKAHYLASDEVDRNSFSVYVKNLLKNTEFVAINGAAFVERVKFEDRDEYLERVRNDNSVVEGGYPDFNIKPKQDSSEYYVLTYLEPFSEAFGYDQRSESKRRANLEEARDTNETVASEMVELVGEDTFRKAILIMTPLYENNVAINTVEQRRESLIGFISTALFVEEYIDLLLKDNDISQMMSGVDIEIYDESAVFNEDNLVYSNFNENTNLDSKMEVVRKVGNREWTFVVARSGDEGYYFYKYVYSILLLISGVVISFILYRLSDSINDLKDNLSRCRKERDVLTKKLNSQRESFSKSEYEKIAQKVERLSKEITEKNTEIERVTQIMIDREKDFSDFKKKNV